MTASRKVFSEGGLGEWKVRIGEHIEQGIPGEESNVNK